MTKERNLARKMNRRLSKLGKVYRIENAAGVGMPDAIFFCGGLVHMLEYKIAYSKQAILCQPSQLAWWTEVGPEYDGGYFIVENSDGSIDSYRGEDFLAAERVTHGEAKVRVYLQRDCEPNDGSFFSLP